MAGVLALGTLIFAACTWEAPDFFKAPGAVSVLSPSYMAGQVVTQVVPASPCQVLVFSIIAIQAETLTYLLG